MGNNKCSLVKKVGKTIRQAIFLSDALFPLDMPPENFFLYAAYVKTLKILEDSEKYQIEMG